MGLLDDNRIPIGLGMALAQNTRALETFSALDSYQQDEVIRRTHELNSASDMRTFVNELADNKCK